MVRLMFLNSFEIFFLLLKHPRHPLYFSYSFFLVFVFWFWVFFFFLFFWNHQNHRLLLVTETEQKKNTTIAVAVYIITEANNIIIHNQTFVSRCTAAAFGYDLMIERERERERDFILLNRKREFLKNDDNDDHAMMMAGRFTSGRIVSTVYSILILKSTGYKSAQSQF